MANYNKEADKRWIEKNKERRRFLTYRGQARGFIRNHAQLEDLAELTQLIEVRKALLKSQSED